MVAERRVTCIYCSTEIDPTRGAGDHVIPAALGRFRDELRFRRICRHCNATIGALEETLLRSAPEALFRRFVPAGRGKRGNSWVAAKGGERPKALIRDGDHTELIELCPDNPDNAHYIDQLIVRDSKDVEHHIRLHPNMTVDSLRRRILDASPAPNSRIYLHAQEPHNSHYVSLLAKLYPDSPYIKDRTVEPGVARIPGRMKFSYSFNFYRAVAKIAFHYYLVVNRRGLRGDEPEFADIRRFIMDGGDHKEFFDAGSARFVSPFRALPGGGAILSAVWAHTLASDEEEKEVVVNVMLFAGPMRLPPSHHIRVARLSSPLILPCGQSAHEYVYHDETDEQGYAGFVSEASARRLN